jgi:predicted double-glycine peptidase
LLALAGVFLGRWFSRLPKPYWTIGYFLPLALVLVYGIGMNRPALSLVPPMSWMTAGRNKFAVIGFITTMLFTTPLSRLRPVRVRVIVCLLMALAAGNYSVWPFLAPALNHGYLAGLETHIDSDGVCHQSTDYNCGPAAAVTALRRLGFPAGEGEIAILAHTSSATGTPPDILARALQKRYKQEGLRAEYRVFDNLNQLKQAGLTLAVIRYNFWLDHYVTVLEVTDTFVQVGDPILGLARFTLDEFKAKWRFTGVVLGRP